MAGTEQFLWGILAGTKKFSWGNSARTEHCKTLKQTATFSILAELPYKTVLSWLRYSVSISQGYLFEICKICFLMILFLNCNRKTWRATSESFRLMFWTVNIIWTSPYVPWKFVFILLVFVFLHELWPLHKQFKDSFPIFLKQKHQPIIHMK